ncbi:hypothetical protein Desca_2174 [Desulfotomaculum nigrificans CO-1-SRB]|uniref:Type 4 fimbrial biogenesis protein PilX N-terminal domain-containing protein n=1 Tax=Desulfotomaculum nigrificans (strain DSM 14880 / VKM B-2319 / CO-1-SRB) TaxID=868595 RepID=F6BA44_DESCC|nr:pilus assembly PilX N-terminal domain-containing protein [Desulfotomaculum nigrificans]AEF95013.1 hypothetical protein Desca_2174 [Desulfotomaculum nigrificans CO-1-SRB]
MNKSLKRCQGIALPVVIMVTTLLMVLVAGLITLTTQEKQNAGNEVNMTKALYLADAGIEMAMQQLENDFSWQAPINHNFDNMQTVEVTITPQDAETRQIKATGIIKDEQGKTLAQKDLVATVSKSISPAQYKDKPQLPAVNNIFDISKTLPNTEDDKKIYYYKGNLSISGTYSGKWLIAVDGNVTIADDLSPANPHQGNPHDLVDDVLVIICSGNVQVLNYGNGNGGNPTDVWAVVYTKKYTGNPHTRLNGKIVGDYELIQPNARYNDEDTNKVERFVRSFYTYFSLNLNKPVLVKWQELYPVFYR